MGIRISYGSSIKDLTLDGTGVTATMATRGCQMANNIVVSISDENLIASNIKSGVTIFGIAGTYTGAAPKITITNRVAGQSSDGDVAYALSADKINWTVFTILSNTTTSIDISGYKHIKFNNPTAETYKIIGVEYDDVEFTSGETGSYDIYSGQTIIIEQY